MLATTDFTGYFKIAQDNATAEILTTYIEKYEKKYLVELFGYDLYVLFLASFAGAPSLPTGRFLTVYNELAWQLNECGRASDYCHDPMDIQYIRVLSDGTSSKKLSEGILKMLKGFIFFEFVKEYGVEVSQTGVTENKNENSEKATGQKIIGLVEDRHNDAVKSFKVIRQYMIDHPTGVDGFEEYDGVDKQEIHMGGAF